MREIDPAEASFLADLQVLLSGGAGPRRWASCPSPIHRLCAVDASYSGERVVAVATEFLDGALEGRGVYRGRCHFPYVSGLLCYREGPFVVEAVRRLANPPELVCFDGHGIAHPRSAGLATVCGMVLGLPTVGMAKSLMRGTAVASGGETGPIMSGDRWVGLAERTGASRRYWSPGHGVSTRQLATIVSRYGQICLQAMRESDRAARIEIRAWNN